MSEDGLFHFPDPVNETAARVVAGGVVLLASAAALTASPWFVAPLAYGFVARVLTGPTLSPLGQFATRVVAPRLPAKPVPGPPKRFAQGIGAALSLGAVAALLAGAPAVVQVLAAAIAFAAALEAAFAFCLGCKIFALLIRVGLIPERACAACGDLRLAAPRSGTAAAGAARQADAETPDPTGVPAAVRG